MNTQSIEIIQFVTLILAINFASVVIGLKLIELRHSLLGSALGGNRCNAVERFRSFSNRLRILTDKIQLLEEHSKEYHLVLCANGFSELMKMQEYLHMIKDVIGGPRPQVSRRESLKILEWLDADNFGGPIPQPIEAIAGDDAPLLRLWEPRANRLLIDVSVALAKSATKTQSLGIRREHKRKPTLLSVREVLHGLDPSSK